MTLYVEYFCILLEFFCTFLLIKSFQGKTLAVELSDVLFLIVQVTAGPVPDEEIYLILGLFWGQLVYFTYSFLQTGKKLIPTIFLHCVTTLFLYIVQGASSLLLYPVMSILPIDCLPPIGSIITLVIILIVRRLVPCATMYQRILNGNFPIKFLILNSYLVGLLITLFYKTHMRDVYEYIVLIFATILLMIFVNVCVFYYENQLREQKKALLAYEKNRPIFETLIEDIRSNQHEFNNQIQSIAMLANVCDTYESLRDSLLKYTAEYNTGQRAYPLLTLNLPLIASTLYNLSAMAENKGIKILFNIPGSNIQCRVSEHIVVDFLHILTQNAIEATEPDKEIYITLLNQDDRFFFEVQNPVEKYIPVDEISNFFQKGYSTKTEEDSPKPENATPHGYGLSELLSRVDKLHGTVSADCVFNEDCHWMIFSLLL